MMMMMMMMMMIELEISGIQDVRHKYKQNWINHLERTDNTRLPKHALNCKPRGGRDRGRLRNPWPCVDAGTGQTNYSWGKMVMIQTGVILNIS